MTFVEIILVKGKTRKLNTRCICKCDTCNQIFQHLQSAKCALSKEHHFCSTQCANISRKNGGISHKKSKQTCLNHYGVENPSQVVEVQDKMKATCLDRHGVEHPSQSKIFQDKMKATCFVNNGVENPLQSEEIQEKIKATNLKRYGVECTMQCKEIFDKVQRSSWNTTQIFHWKTGEICNCRASYEVAVVTWLNEKHIDFDWQIEFETPLLTPKGRLSKYYIDLHILDGKHEDTWIEIKGLERNMKKWEWFHSQYPNSELWNLPRLKELGIK